MDSNNDTSTIGTEASYQQDYYTLGTAAFVSDTFLVPIYNEIPIWGYKTHTEPISNFGSYPLTRILSDSMEVGSSWEISYWSGTGISGKIIAKDTSIAISSESYHPTIVVEEYYSEGPSDYIWIAKRYYTKDIGLVREDIFDAIDSTINTKEIVDFHINR